MEKITISIVSHGQAKLIEPLLDQLSDFATLISKVIITINIPEIYSFKNQYNFSIQVIKNETIKGFGANHNQAYRSCVTRYFCVMNPDIYIQEDPFVEIVEYFKDEKIGVLGPQIHDKNFQLEDNGRYFPTMTSLFMKFLLKDKGIFPIDQESSLTYPDWIAGMFMVFPSRVFEDLEGFDEKYFMYYEDIDLCLRIKKYGLNVGIIPSIKIIHDARRDSHKKLKYMLWHAKSIIRFIVKKNLTNSK